MNSERGDAYAVPAPVRAAAEWSWRLLLIGAAIAVGGWLIGRVQAILVPVVVALLITVLLTPARNFLWHRLGLARGLAVAVCVLGTLGFIGLLMYMATRQLYGGFSDLRDQALVGVEEVHHWLTTGPLGLDAAQVDQYWRQIQSSLTDGIGTEHIVTGALGAATTAGHFIVGTLIVVFCTIFFLLDGSTIWAWIVNLLPRTARERVHQAGRRGLVTLSNYINIQILVAFIDAVGIGLGVLFFVPHLAFPIAVLVFIGSFVPVIGAILTGVIACLVVFVSSGMVQALIMAIIVLVVQQLESNVLRPVLMGHAVSLHPVAVALVVAAASMLWGIPGALFGVPLAAVANTVVLYFFGHDKYPELGLDDHVPILRKRPSFEDLSLTGLTGTLRRHKPGEADSDRTGLGARITNWRNARSAGSADDSAESAEQPQEQPVGSTYSQVTRSQ